MTQNTPKNPVSKVRKHVISRKGKAVAAADEEYRNVALVTPRS